MKNFDQRELRIYLYLLMKEKTKMIFKKFQTWTKKLLSPGNFEEQFTLQIFWTEKIVTAS